MSSPSDVALISQAHIERYISYGAAAALLPMFVDYALTFRDERRYIWPKARVSRYAKMYIMTRYLGLVAQILHVGFAIWRASQTYIAPSLCRSWYTYQAIVIQVLTAVVDGLLMRGVYAIFSGSYWIMSVLAVLAAAQPGSALASMVVALPDAPFTQTCLVAEVHSGLIYFGSGALTTHALILILLVWKYFAGGHARSPLRIAILRDTTLAVAAVSVRTPLPCYTYVHLSHMLVTPHPPPPPHESWLFCVLWVSAGRIIVGWEAARSSETGTGAGVLTSHITITDDASVYALSRLDGEVQKGV
ncbi:hypothetical protein BV22DRAFT_1130950 [Leucogyrophana mollusca]|uniref:Uncharacterized protein n=1 Tax=Leucogyrophana mollusca TaxID=85980 RepID=A0ACB8BEA4_9AGAM|nr:hypothetical protein BV22DRAFT_1130950 [Leucogyrophana mollusca]